MYSSFGFGFAFYLVMGVFCYVVVSGLQDGFNPELFWCLLLVVGVYYEFLVVYSASGLSKCFEWGVCCCVWLYGHFYPFEGGGLLVCFG